MAELLEFVFPFALALALSRAWDLYDGNVDAGTVGGVAFSGAVSVAGMWFARGLIVVAAICGLVVLIEARNERKRRTRKPVLELA